MPTSVTVTAPQKNRPTMRDVAREANVSLATVSYIFNDSKQSQRITPATRHRVLAAVEKLGYRLHPIGRALQQGQTNQLILLIVTWDLALSHSKSAMAISRAAVARGYELTVHVADDDELANSFLNRQMMHHIGGLLLLWDSPAAKESPLARLATEGLPIIDLLPGGHKSISTVTPDREEAFCRGTQHLTELGHRHIGILCDTSRRARTSLRKLSGYHEGLRRSGLEARPDLLQNVVQFGFEGGFNGFLELAHRCPDLTAALCLNDSMALGAIAAAHDLDWSCPEDVSIMGFGDATEGGYFTPKLTTIGLSAQRVADTAVDLLQQTLTHRPLQATTVLVKEDLIIRESTGPARVFESIG